MAVGAEALLLQAQWALLSRTRCAAVRPIFGADQNHLRWSHFKETAPESMFKTVRDEVFPSMKSLGDQSANGEGGSTYKRHMEDALDSMLW